MKNISNFLKSFLSAVGVVVYVLGIGLLLSNGERIFGTGEDTFIIPVFMLLLFVISALITGLLVLGRPIHLYLSGSKKEAFTLLFFTIGWLAFFLVLVVIMLMFL